MGYQTEGEMTEVEGKVGKPIPRVIAAGLPPDYNFAARLFH
jgi:hypothetical protein